jgi:hypothetical protein
MSWPGIAEGWRRVARGGHAAALLLCSWLLVVPAAQAESGSGSGTYSIDDNNPVGSGLTISNRPVPAFSAAVGTFGAFVNGVTVPFASSDADTDDEFQSVLASLDGFLGNIQTFRSALQQLNVNLQAAAPSASTFGGLNPATYAWKDSRGDHSVAVQVGPFKIPRVVKKKTGNWLVGKICLTLTDFQDNGTNAWVRVTRRDPSTAMGLWRWNPFGGQMTKISRVSYSFDRVDIAGTR